MVLSLVNLDRFSIKTGRRFIPYIVRINLSLLINILITLSVRNVYQLYPKCLLTFTPLSKLADHRNSWKDVSSTGVLFELNHEKVGMHVITCLVSVNAESHMFFKSLIKRN